MTIKRKCNPSAAGESSSVKKPRLDGDQEEERPMTEKEKRKVARMIRNRQSAQISRNKKQEHLDNLEATVVRLQAENKDLIKRLVEQNTRSIMQGDRFVPPLSPDPSSIVERELRQASVNVSPRNQDASEDEDEDDEDDCSFPSSSQRAMSSVSPARPQVHPNPAPSSGPPLQYTQALVSLTTENATLKDRLAKLEKVVQLLLGMNAGGIMGGSQPFTNDLSAGTDVLRLFGPDQNGSPIVSPGTLNPLITTPPFIPQFDPVSDHHLASTSMIAPASLAQTTPTTAPPTFPTTEIQDHARHPAAMTTTLTQGSALQRACFSSLALASPPVKESREQEIREMTDKVMGGFQRVLEWRTNCLIEERPRELSLTMAMPSTLPVISSAA